MERVIELEDHPHPWKKRLIITSFYTFLQISEACKMFEILMIKRAVIHNGDKVYSIDSLEWLPAWKAIGFEISLMEI